MLTRTLVSPQLFKEDLLKNVREVRDDLTDGTNSIYS